MKNILLKITTLTALSSTLVFASGWRIPEQSSTSVALSGAYVANSHGADAAYYNPANMSFNPNVTQFEASLMHIGLTSIKYDDSRTSTYDSESKKEGFILPTFFYSSKDNDGIRYGISFTAPGGLSKRWDDSFAKTSAEEFSLRIMELNPAISYLVTPQFSIGGGLRVIYSDGVVKSDGLIDVDKNGVPETRVTRDMEGDALEFGYNLALAYKPSEVSNISATYRSNVNIKEEGSATLTNTAFGPIATASFRSEASVEIPLPAVLAIAYSHKFDKTTIEFEYDRTYWSKYEALDFQYNKTLPNSILTSAFDDPKTKDWKDTNAYRIGITYEYSDSLTLLAGYAIDENPAPTKTIGFELPDSDAKLYSVGANYKLDDKSSLGFGYLLDVKESRTVSANDSSIDGEFTNAKAHLISVAYRTTF
jgi:long-chain fatty acid transport protein